MKMAEGRSGIAVSLASACIEAASEKEKENSWILPLFRTEKIVLRGFLRCEEAKNLIG